MRKNIIIKRPKVGVGVYIIKNNKILMGKRKSAHGQGTWCPPGGHLEFYETVEEAAIREVSEETGIQIKNLKIGPYTNDFHRAEDKHYITLAVIALHHSGEPQIIEPDKLDQWDWFAWDNLPQPLFLPVRNIIKQGFNPFIYHAGKQ